MLKEVLTSCQFVSNNSVYVRINLDKVDEVAKNLAISKNTYWLGNSPFGILEFDIDTIVNFLLIYQGIGGFSYWGTPKWTIEAEKGPLDGAYAMIYVLVKETRKNNEFLNPNYLLNLSFEDFSDIFKGNVEIPLLKERHENLKKISRVVHEKMNDNFYEFVKDINTDEDLFNIIITYFGDVFGDIVNYKEHQIYIYKLAQLLTSDILHIKAIKEGTVVDYSHLVGCADYKIPQVLRALGVLEYNEELANIVDNKIEIPSGSAYEAEIRANMLVAINQISSKIEGSCPIEVNDAIWVLGQDKSQNPKPYHLTRTTFY